MFCENAYAGKYFLLATVMSVRFNSAVFTEKNTLD